MVTIHVAWVLPTTRSDGVTPLQPGDISKLQIQITSPSTPPGGPTQVVDLPADAVSYDTPDITGAFGSYAFSVQVFDNETPPVGGATNSTSTTYPAPAVLPPGAVTGLTATLVTT